MSAANIFSKNSTAETLMGKRDTSGIPINQPCEMGYICPVCKYTPVVNGNYDERLHWSEYNGFLWCRVCNKDYPSALCQPNILRPGCVSSFFTEIRKPTSGLKS